MSKMDFHASQIEISPSESASYTRDMLIQMRKMAQQQHQTVLAHLLSLAAEEARALKNNYKQDTLPPG